jgi:hypothetical protein
MRVLSMLASWSSKSGVPARDRRKHATQRGRKADLLWTLVGLAVLQVGFLIWAEWKAPELYDLEYGARIAILHERLGEDPQRPIAIVLGSSRIGQAFLPEMMPPLKSAAGEDVLAFNFSHLMSGPVMNLMGWRRLEREGVKPRWLVLELVPTLMMGEHPASAAGVATAPDLPLLLDYFPRGRALRTFVKNRANPWHQHRQALLRRWAPSLATQASHTDDVKLGPCGGDAGWNLPNHVPDEDRRRMTARVAAGAQFLRAWKVDPRADRAIRTVLEECRRQGIATLLLLTPESSELRACYSPDSLADLDAYCTRLSREFQVPLVNARAWLEDDDFSDGHHVIRRGAERFTLRLAREALQPLVANQLANQLVPSP